jgi:hypothetical protein
VSSVDVAQPPRSVSIDPVVTKVPPDLGVGDGVSDAGADWVATDRVGVADGLGVGAD